MEWTSIVLLQVMTWSTLVTDQFYKFFTFSSFFKQAVPLVWMIEARNQENSVANLFKHDILSTLFGKQTDPITLEQMSQKSLELKYGHLTLVMLQSKMAASTWACIPYLLDVVYQELASSDIYLHGTVFNGLIGNHYNLSMTLCHMGVRLGETYKPLPLAKVWLMEVSWAKKCAMACGTLHSQKQKE